MICKHYNRTLYPICKKCKKTYPCHRCHDEYEDHIMDRSSIKKMKCIFCFCIQKIGEKCINNECIGKKHLYFCKICGLWENNKKKNIFHCNKCNICRIGFREKYIHCDKCNLCIHKEIFDNHHCKIDLRDKICSICLEKCWDSQESTVTLKCGHFYHQNCLNGWLKNDYRCPICKKTCFNSTNLWNHMDSFISTITIPDEYKNWKTEISCNDCNKNSITNYCFQYHKCKFCNSWNTTIKNIIKNN